MRWDEFPRIKVWTQEEVDEAKNRDRKASEDYGRITVGNWLLVGRICHIKFCII